MSWIVADLWRELDEHRAQYAPYLSRSSPQGFAIINEIAARVGSRWGLVVQVNFPVGARNARDSIGHENLSLLIDPGRKKFEHSTEADVKRQLELLGSMKLEAIGRGYEGFQAKLDSGRIDCLPGGVHLWCTITPRILDFLDWIFTNAYGLSPPVGTE
jgi:hypothetical protein